MNYRRNIVKVKTSMIENTNLRYLRQTLITRSYIEFLDNNFHKWLKKFTKKRKIKMFNTRRDVISIFPEY